MRKRWIVGALAGTLLFTVGGVSAHEQGKELPPGPIRDRHELMHGIGKDAKAIGAALKIGDLKPIGPAAEKIAADAAKIDALFPPGSTHPDSRAKPEIWENWAKFQELTKKLQTSATALAAAAASGANVRTPADAMFSNCKSCHDQFRLPEKKKDGD